LVCAWPGDAQVQWGAHGVVFEEKVLKSYDWAFFEAFPSKHSNAGGYLRGEGKTIEEAERACFSKYERQLLCSHIMGREDYDNGGMICRRCRAFKSSILPPIAKLGEWKRPVSETIASMHRTLNAISEDNMPAERKRRQRHISLRIKHFGILPTKPKTPTK